MRHTSPQQSQERSDQQKRLQSKRVARKRQSRRTESMSSSDGMSPGSNKSVASSDPIRQYMAHPIDTQLSTLSLMSRSPTFSSPQSALPQSDEEQVLSQELALCDFRTYLLAMEAQNRERLRQARGSECICHEPAINPVDQHPHLRDYQMALQAHELQRRRTELQGQLEELTGRPYPIPDIYAQASEAPMRTCGVTAIPIAQSVGSHAGASGT